MDQSMFNLLISVIGAGFITGIVTWYLNEKSKRIYQEYKRKEIKYSELIRCLRGFYEDSTDKELKNAFLNQYRLCWMYCSDDVIQKTNKFLKMVQTGQEHSDEEKEKAVGELILAIRIDLISRKPLKKTTLKPEDFKHLTAT
jgi:hypothetical protein